MSASIDTYRNVEFATASPRHIVQKALAAAGRFLGDAEDCLRNDDSPEEALMNARTVIGGLMTALNFDAGEMAQNFLKLYLFVLDRIQTTSTEQRDTGLAEARQVLLALQTGWEEMSAEEASQSAASAGQSVGLSLRG